MSIKLERFDPRKMADSRVCAFIGKRNTGKTTLVTDILWHKRHIPAGLAMSGTEDGNGHYKQFIPDMYVYGDYNKEAVEKLIDRQKRMIAKYGKDKAPAVFLLFDDLMYDKAFMRDQGVRQLFMNGRHWNIFFMMTTQYILDMSPMIRSNCDYVFVCRDNVRQNRENLYKCFFGMFPSFDVFCTVMDQCTENYECLVLDTTVKSNKIQDQVYWYKAPIHTPFRVGGPGFWKYHQQHYNPRAIQPSTVPGRKAPITVQKVGVSKSK